jgi:spermidine synthase
MNQAFQELDFQQTSIGEISLRRRVLPSEEVVYEVKLDQAFLMSSMFHAVEEALADLGLAELGAGAWDVVVGGLGLGYTAVAVLAHQTIQSLTVIDLLAPVIEWHQKGLVPLGPLLTADARCRLLEGDFFALAAGPTGFDAGRRFHAVLLDIDHSPSNLLHPRHGSFYTTAGLQAMSAHLQPRGVFAMWSDDPPDEAFLELLRTVFGQVRAEIVTFPNPLLDCDSASTVYVCRTE